MADFMDENARLRAQLAEKEAECERLRTALDRIAKETMWGKCGPRIDEDRLYDFCSKALTSTSKGEGDG